MGLYRGKRGVQIMHMPKKTTGNLNSRTKRPTYLAAWREFRGFPPDLAAKLIGVDRSYLQRHEQGKVVNGYSQVFLEAAAEVYGCEPADLISRHPPEPLKSRPDRGW